MQGRANATIIAKINNKTHPVGQAEPPTHPNPDCVVKSNAE